MHRDRMRVFSENAEAHLRRLAAAHKTVLPTQDTIPTARRDAVQLGSTHRFDVRRLIAIVFESIMIVVLLSCCAVLLFAFREEGIQLLLLVSVAFLPVWIWLAFRMVHRIQRHRHWREK
jgi:hypothetical protein